MIEYKEREAIKSRAWTYVRDTKLSMHERAVALLTIIDMHYMRMIEELNECSPDVRKKAIAKITEDVRQANVSRDQYYSNWIYANVLGTDFIPLHGVIEYIINEMGYVASSHYMMDAGMTSYNIHEKR